MSHTKEPCCADNQEMPGYHRPCERLNAMVAEIERLRKVVEAARKAEDILDLAIADDFSAIRRTAAADAQGWLWNALSTLDTP